MSTQLKKDTGLTDCEQQLRRTVDSIADDFYNDKAVFYFLDEEEQLRGGLKYYEDYDVRYTYNSSGELIGARVLLAGGGPNIWLDTLAEEVQGFWGTDKYVKYCGNCDSALDYFQEIQPLTKKIGDLL